MEAEEEEGEDQGYWNLTYLVSSDDCFLRKVGLRCACRENGGVSGLWGARDAIAVSTVQTAWARGICGLCIIVALSVR